MHYEPVKTPIKYQREAAECSAVALWIILAYYGKYVPIDELRAACNVSRDGTRHIDVVRAGRRYGLEAKGLKRNSIASLREIKPPFVVYYNYNHSVVVEGVTENCLYVNEGGMGRVTQTYEAFDDGFTGVVLTFYPSENFKKDGRKREFKVLGDMRAFFRDSNSQKFRQRFFDMPMQYFYQNGYAHASYLMHAQQLVAQQMPKMCAKIALLAGAVSLLCAILLEKNTALGLAGLLCICIALLLLMRLWELSIPLFKDVWENYALKSSSFPDFPDNFKRAKIGRLEDARIFSAYSWTVLRLATQTPAKEALMAKDTQLLGVTLALPIMALLWPKTGIGEIVSASGLAWGIWQVRMQLPEFQKTYSLMKEVMRLNDEYKHTAVESPPLLNMEESLPSPLLAIKNLHFDFQAGTATAINGLDLTLEKGELLGIVGKSGSGKSALAQLLAGLHQPQSGEIRLFGRPFSEWPAAQRAQVIGLVVQQAPLFAGSVRDNIGSSVLSDEALLRAMQTACIEEGTISLDDTVQDRGKNFTHSQRQRLELARALARQPKLLILDEATNGMPSALERQILQNIKEMGIACLFVTHRLDNTDVLDRVLEMRNGAAGELA